MLRGTVLCLNLSPCSHTNQLVMRAQGQREEPWQDLVHFQEVRQALRGCLETSDPWKPLSVTVL